MAAVLPTVAMAVVSPDWLANNPSWFDAAETFTAPGTPTTDYAGARMYAIENNSMVWYQKCRMICGGSIYISKSFCQNPAFQKQLKDLRIPFVAGCIGGFIADERRAGNEIPAFMTSVFLDQYYDLEGAGDNLLENLNDDLQHGIAPDLSVIKTVTPNASYVLHGDAREKMESELEIDLRNVCDWFLLKLYSRDDTGVPRRRTDFESYYFDDIGDGSGGYKNLMKPHVWKYLTWPRVIDVSKNDPSYVHGLIDTTGTSSGENYLLHIGVTGGKNRRVVSGPYNETNYVKVVCYYDNLMDWYRLENVNTNSSYLITTSNVIDRDNKGVVYVFSDEYNVLWSTNAESASSRAMSMCRINDALDGFSFKGVTNTMWICFALGGEQGEVLYREGDGGDRTAENQLVRYAFTISETDAPPSEPGFTNQIVFARTSDLVHEGDVMSCEVTRNKPDSGRLDVHVVRDDVQVGNMTWQDGEYGRKSIEWNEPVDDDYNSDTNVVVKYKNYFMNISRNVVLRDRLVKYQIHERKFYEPDGVYAYPEKGDWFMDYDDILRAKIPDPGTNICSMIVQSDSPRLIHIQSSDLATTCQVFDSCSTSSVWMTGFEYDDDDALYVRRETVERHKRPIGSPRMTAGCHTNVVVELTPFNVIRIRARNGAKIETFESLDN